MPLIAPERLTSGVDCTRLHPEAQQRLPIRRIDEDRTCLHVVHEDAEPCGHRGAAASATQTNPAPALQPPAWIAAMRNHIQVARFRFDHLDISEIGLGDRDRRFENVVEADIEVPGRGHALRLFWYRGPAGHARSAGATSPRASPLQRGMTIADM
jgi:hypothetical protein